jgi:hypothetical protein
MLAVRCGPPTLYGASALAASRQTRSPLCKARAEPGARRTEKKPPRRLRKSELHRVIHGPPRRRVETTREARARRS